MGGTLSVLRDLIVRVSGETTRRGHWLQILRLILLHEVHHHQQNIFPIPRIHLRYMNLVTGHIMHNLLSTVAL